MAQPVTEGFFLLPLHHPLRGRYPSPSVLRKNGEDLLRLAGPRYYDLPATPLTLSLSKGDHAGSVVACFDKLSMSGSGAFAFWNCCPLHET